MKKLLYLMIAFSLFSCTKFGKNVIIKGRAYNPVTGEGLAGVTFSLQKGTYWGWNGGYTTFKTATSDENGNFELGALSLSVEQITVGPGSMGGLNLYPIGWVNPETGKQIGGTYTMRIEKGKTHADFQAVPYGYLKLSIHNVNCQGGGDSMRFRFQTIGKSDFEFWSNYRTGCYMYDDPGEGTKVPMGWRYCQWEVTRNGLINYYNDSIFVPNNNSTTFTINY
jgi:hypothetical protein